jgi:hypothetical protein
VPSSPIRHQSPQTAKKKKKRKRKRKRKGEIDHEKVG